MKELMELMVNKKWQIIASEKTFVNTALLLLLLTCCILNCTTRNFVACLTSASTNTLHKTDFDSAPHDNAHQGLGVHPVCWWLQLEEALHMNNLNEMHKMEALLSP
ncbi:hypothetical protein E2C01_003569 [Portunus trituberculatus]|uniref:Uncharacterized protein n=1 Tax=Portunus trituberculatus TaxID=210409 RepID=A0A5B7CP13_PORTR|nr:hypothetical protein [Portunus trituberculatus]